LIDDLPELLALSREFVQEVGFTFSLDHAFDALVSISAHPQGEVLYLKDGYSVACGAVVSYEEMFQRERVGSIVKFYVRRPWRGTGAGRSLLRMCNEWFDLQGCSVSEASTTGGLVTDKLTQNLFKKQGYVPHGCILRRTMV